MTEQDWSWAENHNAYRDEEIKMMLLSRRVRNSKNPFVPQSANWYRFEQGIKEYRALAGIGNLELLKE